MSPLDFPRSVLLLQLIFVILGMSARGRVDRAGNIQSSDIRGSSRVGSLPSGALTAARTLLNLSLHSHLCLLRLTLENIVQANTPLSTVLGRFPDLITNKFGVKVTYCVDKCKGGWENAVLCYQAMPCL